MIAVGLHQNDTGIVVAILLLLGLIAVPRLLQQRPDPPAATDTAAPVDSSD